MEQQKFYLAGKWHSSNSLINVINPHTNKIISVVSEANKEDLNKAILLAEKSQQKLKELSSYERFEILNFISSTIKQNEKKLSELLSKESGKPIKYALGEINRASQTFLIAAEETKRLPKEYISLDWTEKEKGKEGVVKYFPIGVVGGICPFNFPLNLVAHKVAPAIASGCPIIIKPSSTTPLLALELAKIINQTRLPKGAFSVLPMNRETGNMLVTDERIKLLSFTGSPEVGWEMKKNAGKKKVVLELGGNAACIITSSANIKAAIEKCIIGGYAYSGQVCIHTQRIYIHESIFNSFIKDFIKRIKNLNYGNPLKSNTDISDMIDEKNAIRVEKWISEAQKQGAKILFGGKRKKNYIEPTVISGTNKKMKVNSEEVFGPVVIIEKYKSFSEAVKLVNDTPFGLQAGVFTNQQNEIKQAFEEIEAGSVIINDTPTFRVDHMPYGGVKDSGLGREGIKYAILDMMEPKLLVQ